LLVQRGELLRFLVARHRGHALGMLLRRVGAFLAHVLAGLVARLRKLRDRVLDAQRLVAVEAVRDARFSAGMLAEESDLDRTGLHAPNRTPRIAAANAGKVTKLLRR